MRSTSALIVFATLAASFQSSLAGIPRRNQAVDHHRKRGSPSMPWNHHLTPKPEATATSVVIETSSTVPEASNSPAATPIATPSPVIGESSPGPAAGRVSQADIDTWLTSTNLIRQRYQAPNVTWSTKLESYAKSVSDTCKFAHSSGPYGENLAAGWPKIDPIVQAWFNNTGMAGCGEACAYDPANPTHSHFTQLVWATTTEIGCSMITCPEISGTGLKNAVLTTCSYNPPGNYFGEYTENVKAKKGGFPL